MVDWTPATVAEATGGLLRGPGELTLSGIVTDSRQVPFGGLFVALRGEAHDGHEYVEAAWRAGASAVLVSRPVEPPVGRAVIRVPDTLLAYGDLARFRRDRWDGLVVGVTGSVGKSSAKELIADVLEQAQPTARSQKSFNNEIGLPATLLALTDERAVVLEMAMRGAGQITYLAEIARPKIGVLTRIGLSHIGLLGSPEAVARAKGELLEALGGDGVAVLNADDPHQPAQARRHGGEVIWYGVEQPAEVRATRVSTRGLAGSRVRLATPLGSAEVTLAVPGRHGVSNALAAVGVGIAAGLPLATIVAGLESSRPLPLRMEIQRLAVGATLVNDAYNAAPDSMRAALAVLADEPCGGRRIAVLGDMLELGQVAEVEHLAVGHAAARAVDVVVGVGELGRHIAAGARDEGGAEVFGVADPESAGTLLRELVRSGDLILLKASRAVGLDTVAARLEVAE